MKPIAEVRHANDEQKKAIASRIAADSQIADIRLSVMNGNLLLYSAELIPDQYWRVARAVMWGLRDVELNRAVKERMFGSPLSGWERFKQWASGLFKRQPRLIWGKGR